MQFTRTHNVFCLALVCLVCAAVISSCVTTPQKTVRGDVGRAQGQWRGKAIVKSVREGKSGTINLDVVAQEPSKMRMEVTASFGVHLASIALNGSRFQYFLTKEKKFVTSAAESGTIRPLLPVDLSPKIIMAILFDRELDHEAGWQCEKDTNGLAKLCHRPSDGTKIEWTDRQDMARRLKLSSKEGTADLWLAEGDLKVEVKQELFELVQPAS